MAAPTYSSKFEEMATRYEDITGDDFMFFDACKADAAWLLTMSVLEARSTTGSPELTG